MLRVLTRPFALLAGGAVITTALLAGCGHRASPATAPTTAPASSAAPTSSASSAPADHLAPRLEARLPASLNGTALTRISTVGSAIFGQFGGTAWSQRMTAFLHRHGKSPADLQYAQVFDPAKKLSLDAGAFDVAGIPAAALAAAIVDSSKPDSPGLTAKPANVAGKPVTVESDPESGSALVLYAHDGAVFYVDGNNRFLAAEFVAAAH